MSETGYNYNLETDFPGGININNLKTEINNSSITTTLSYISVVGSSTEVRIFFITALSGPEITTLNGVVATHDLTPNTVTEETVTVVNTSTIQSPTGATGGVSVEAFNFTNNIFKPSGATGAIQGCIINCDINTVTNIDNNEIKALAGIAATKIANGSVDNTEFERLNNISSAIVGITDTQTLTNKSINADSNNITNIDNADIKAAAAISATKIANGSVDNTEFERLGTVASAIVGITDTQTLTNKTLTSPILTAPQINDASLTNQFIFSGSEISANRTITIPVLTGNDTFVFQSHAQTLTNKTINADNNTITNIDNNEIKAGAAIDATKIANGTVNNTQFQYINGLTSNVQTQLNSLAASRRFYAYHNISISIPNTGAWSDISLDVEVIKDSDFTHAANSAIITINTTGVYLVSARCSTDSTGARTSCSMRLLLNGSPVLGSIAYMYNRTTAAGEGTGHISIIMSLTAGNTIRLQANVLDGGAVNTIPQASSITITRA